MSDEILIEIKKILNDYYLKYCKRAIIAYEQAEGKLSDKAVHEIRDALDHIAIAVSENRTTEEAMRDVNAIKEHFRRVSVDPIEFLAEERLSEIIKIRNRGIWWWKFLFIPSPKNIDEDINKIVDLIIIGRENKGVDIEKAFQNMWDAYYLTRELRNKIKPADLYSRFFGLMCLFLGIIFKIIIDMINHKYHLF